MERKKLTVGEIKKALEGVSDDTVIVIAVDPEGNSYRAIDSDGVLRDHNFNEDTHEVGFGEIDDAMKMRLGITEDEIMTDGDPCIVLWPL